MSKLAQVVVEDAGNEKMQDAEFDGDKLYLKEKKEDEIRTRLEEFAKELSELKKLRGDDS